VATIGHWSSLAEAQKLVQAELLLSGVIETIIKEGSLIPRLPVMQIDSKEIIYYREKTVVSVLDYVSVGEQLSWKADQDYGTKQSISLVIAAGARRIENAIAATYKNPNDYRAQAMKEITKGVAHWIEHQLIYGTGTGGQAQGLKKIIADIAGLAEVPSDYSSTLNINENSALSLANLRALTDSIRPDKPDLLLVNRTFGRRFDAMAQEAAIEGTAAPKMQGIIQFGADQLGARVTYFDGIPIIRSDFLTQTEDANGDAAASTRTSIYAIKFGTIQEGGLCAVFGGQGGSIGKFFRVDLFDKLEDFDATGVRVIGYFNFALGSIKQLGRIYNIDPAAAITA